ncbi:hypothetical protein J007_06102 [Cryptococcus neoformans]|nr:hypothetical protein J007_06102 [Cryptococcus neoformans var. grubii]OXC58364.1 hypothetical protein C358_06190 [Cryptococcus neoformans var. grubii MW-RSA852]
MVAPRKEIWLEPNYGCEATQSGSPNFPNVYRGNCRDPILVVVDAGDGAGIHWKDLGDGLGKKTGPDG